MTRQSQINPEEGENSFKEGEGGRPSKSKLKEEEYISQADCEGGMPVPG